MKKEELNRQIDFVKLQEHMEKIYLQIGKSIDAQLDKNKIIYDVYCSIAERDKYDITNNSFFPMCKEDLKEETIESGAIVCGKDEPVTLFTVFAWDGKQILTGLHRKQEQFHGTVFMENEEYPVMAELKPCEKYKACISELYFITVQNGFLWKPVNDSLLDGFYEVRLVSGDLPRKKQIQKIQIDFGRYSPVIRFHCFPVWNIEQLTMQGRVKKGADGKGIVYEHTLFEKGIKEDNYLIAEKNQLFYNHIHINGTIISNMDKKGKGWRLLKIHKKVKKPKELPVAGNQHMGKGGKNNFIRHKLETLDFYKHQNNIQNNPDKEKQFIWEYALEQFKWNICFEQLRHWSPYFEVHELIERDGTDKTYTCRYNAMYQYEEIFQKLYENGTYPASGDERVLVDIVTHFLAELDAKRKYSLETYEKQKFEKDLCNGLYGEKCKDIYCMLPFHKQQIILHFLVLQNKVHKLIYEPAGDFDFYIKTVIGLLETGAVYKKKQEENSFYIYLGIRKNEYAGGILYLAKVLFLPVGYKVRVFWQNHFPILNEKKTLKLGEMQLI